MMKEKCVKITNPLWQKIAISLFAVSLVVLALVSWLSPFVPVFAGKQFDIWEAAFCGTLFLATGVGLWRQVMCCAIRADQHDITQNTGFRCQPVRWVEVAAYYLEPNATEASRQSFVGPILLDDNGKVLLRVSTQHFASSKATSAQRQELWQLVAAQLPGKKVEAPFVDFDPNVLAQRDMEIAWQTKSVKWKIARGLFVVFFTLFWFAVFWSPIFYFVSHDIKLSGLAAIIVPPLMMLGPLLPWYVLAHIKKRKIAREWEARDKIES